LPGDGRDPRLLASRALTRSLASALALVIASACGSLQGLGGGCELRAEGSPPPAQALIRTIPLNQRWTGEKATLCWREIRIFDGGFRIIGRVDGEPSRSDAWYAALAGGVAPRLLDEGGRQYSLSQMDARDPSRVSFLVDGLLPPTSPPATGDLLAGVRELTLEVQSVLERVDGPWTFVVPARSGPLETRATAAGRELRLYDLVVRSDGFSVGVMELGSYTPPFAGVRSPYNEFAPARDDKGNTYRVAGAERIGDTPILYLKFTPAPAPDATLTITLDRIFLLTDRTWRGTLTLP
jgi:hypothetical protein